MFGKKNDGTGAADQGSMAADGAADGGTDGGAKTEDMASAPPLKPFSRKGSHGPAKPPTATSFQPDIPRRLAEIPGPTSRRMDRPLGGVGGGEASDRLVVGRDIRLSGEVSACDTLVVEGRVEITLSNARIIEVTPTGHFTGTAEVDEADISGRYDGDLVAREKLIVRAGGLIKGKVRYGRIVIESGGEVSGDMQAMETAGDGT